MDIDHILAQYNLIKAISLLGLLYIYTRASTSDPYWQISFLLFVEQWSIRLHIASVSGVDETLEYSELSKALI